MADVYSLRQGKCGVFIYQEIKREKKEHREVFLGLPLPLFSFGLLALTILDLFGR